MASYHYSIVARFLILFQRFCPPFSLAECFIVPDGLLRILTIWGNGVQLCDTVLTLVSLDLLTLPIGGTRLAAYNLGLQRRGPNPRSKFPAVRHTIVTIACIHNVLPEKLALSSQDRYGACRYVLVLGAGVKYWDNMLSEHNSATDSLSYKISSKSQYFTLALSTNVAGRSVGALSHCSARSSWLLIPRGPRFFKGCRF